MDDSYLFTQSEPEVDTTLKNLSPLADENCGFLKSFERTRQYYDEPKMWHYSSVVNEKYIHHDGRDFSARASGVSFFSQKLAILKCLAESVERLCNFIYKTSYTDYEGQYRNIRNDALNPNLFARFSKQQLQNNIDSRFLITDRSIFRWTECKSLTRPGTILVPSHFIYLSYPYLPVEKSIYLSLSTGVAGGSCMASAIVRGLYEVIERDSFMIFYLNKLEAPKIDFKSLKNDNVNLLLEKAKRYNLNVLSVDLTSDLEVPVVASIVMDRTGIGKAVSVGLKADLQISRAVVGSIEEAFHTRGWIRSEYEKGPRNVTSRDLFKSSDIKLRGLLWYPTKTIKNLGFWINSKNVKRIDRTDTPKSTLSAGQSLLLLTNLLKKLGYGVYYKDISVRELAHLNYFVVKVIILDMQPLYLDERLRLWGGNRLHQVPVKLGYGKRSYKDLYKFPHPFL